jgi:hypothetical protein
MPSTDFNGDGREDLIWRRQDGVLSNWLGTSAGGFTANDQNALTRFDPSWNVVGAGDFNGDGRDDLLWRHFDGTISNWLGTATGGFTINDANAWATISNAWKIVGTGDVNGDGIDDIIWRHLEGTLSNWLGTEAGSFTINDGAAFTNVSTDWQVTGTGDFNGDGHDDILWRHSNGTISNWLGTAAGGFTINDANAWTTAPTDWFVTRTGDFDGDGREDILWRHSSGTISTWLADSSGGFTPNDANAMIGVPLSWSVWDTGDFNGDGRDDILWRNFNSNQFTNWLGRPDGGFENNDINALTSLPDGWWLDIADLGENAGPGAVNRMFGTGSPDILTGTQANDEIYGAGGDDTLDGLGGNDYLDGGEGHDALYGGGGSDTLQSWFSAGNDSFFGGEGRDVFSFSASASTFARAATILDFERGIDALNIRLIGTPLGDLQWLGSNAFTAQGRHEARFANGILEIDGDGDGDADLAIGVIGLLSPSDITFYATDDPWGY